VRAAPPGEVEEIDASVALARLAGPDHAGCRNDVHDEIRLEKAEVVVALYEELHVSIENGSTGEQ
jgi:hypothetical protein